MVYILEAVNGAVHGFSGHAPETSMYRMPTTCNEWGWVVAC